MVSIKYCKCTGTPATNYQDKIYGNGMRVHNDKPDNKGSKCTCCGNVRK